MKYFLILICCCLLHQHIFNPSIMAAPGWSGKYSSLDSANNHSSSNIHGNIYPMAVGNRYQYITQSRQTFPTLSDIDYSLKETRITRDTIINNKKYYGYDTSRIYYSYDQKSNIAYTRYNNNEGIYWDFNYTKDSLFDRYAPLCGCYRGGGMLVDSIFIFNKYWRTHKFTMPNIISYSETFIDGLGILGTSEDKTNFVTYTNTTDSLISALIYDSTGNYTLYSVKQKAQIDFIPFTSISGNSFLTASLKASHPYDKFNRGKNGKVDGIVYLDSVYFEYFYMKDNIKTPVMRQNAARVLNDNVYNLKVDIDTSLIKKGYDFVYRITAKDKALVPNYTFMPDTGFYRAVYDPLLSTPGNNASVFSFSLDQNYPNPFNPATRISYSVSEKSIVKMEVYNSLGQLINVLFNEEKLPGRYNEVFNASGLSSGVYYCRLTSGTMTLLRKMVLLK